MLQYSEWELCGLVLRFLSASPAATGEAFFLLVGRYSILFNDLDGPGHRSNEAFGMLLIPPGALLHLAGRLPHAVGDDRRAYGYQRAYGLVLGYGKWLFTLISSFTDTIFSGPNPIRVTVVCTSRAQAWVAGSPPTRLLIFSLASI